uniref:Beta sliding clamp n=1 Tax=Candidatus Kentrum sp. FM TaxID=2126340 RepID=A0A450VVJ9_9GAMM|nr:MAG: DNA polymerase-3 subunit beta [Candidatus Kentron sp. FM]VFJ51025.1 MAG: DNA polymerase-3 subunit beta [Candidatus Kentron sp. FM]VFK08807.1 MAG: DNA polymerase-3 subunit beta [Candidatus Kentron sp. FM]
MKFTTTREALLEPLARTYSVIESRRTLPILSNVLLATKNNVLSMTGTDMEMELITSVELIDSKPGETTISARKFSEICRALPTEAKISFTQEEGKAIIRSGNSRFVLSTLPVAEYPNSGTLTEGVRITEEQGNIRELIELTQFAMANQDVRYWLNGLLLEISKENIRAVATDGHRLALAELDADAGIDGDILQVIVPRKGVVELSRMLGTGKNEIELCVGSNALQVEFLNTRFTTKLIDGRYPDYSGVLPTLPQCNKEMLVEKELLRQTLIRSAVLCSDGYRSVKMVFDEGLLRISTRNMEQEEADDEISIDYIGEPLEIRFNVTYLLEAVEAIPTKEIRMYFKDVSGSCLIKPVGREDCQYVVMPMKL